MIQIERHSLECCSMLLFQAELVRAETVVAETTPSTLDELQGRDKSGTNVTVYN